MLLAAEVRARKAQCFSSSWWPVTREPDVMEVDRESGDEVLARRGRPIRQILLAQHELMQLGQMGFIEIREHGRVTVA